MTDLLYHVDVQREKVCSLLRDSFSQYKIDKPSKVDDWVLNYDPLELF